MPVLIRNQGYLGIGGYVINDKAGDGDLQNFFGTVSLAYHKKLKHNGELAAGVQGGYSQRSINLSDLYFQEPLTGGTYLHGTSQTFVLGMGNSVQYYTVGGGITFSQAICAKVNYIAGLSINSISQPNELLTKNDRRNAIYTGIIGINWLATKRFTFHPAALFQPGANTINIVAGNEFRYNTLKGLSVFAGAYYRTDDAMNITCGVNTGRFRIGLAYDYNISALNPASNGHGGFMLNVKYLAPDFKSPAKKRFVPCNRF